MTLVICGGCYQAHKHYPVDAPPKRPGRCEQCGEERPTCRNVRLIYAGALVNQGATGPEKAKSIADAIEETYGDARDVAQMQLKDMEHFRQAHPAAFDGPGFWDWSSPDGKWSGRRLRDGSLEIARNGCGYHLTLEADEARKFKASLEMPKPTLEEVIRATNIALEVAQLHFDLDDPQNPNNGVAWLILARDWFEDQK